MKELKFNFSGYPNYKVSGWENCWGYDDKGKKTIGEFVVGDKYWIINPITNKLIREMTIQSIEIIQEV